MFKLKRPCSNCPFKKGQGELFALTQERLTGIIEAAAFQCHKTVQYGEDDAGNELHSSGDHPQQCAGLMAVLRNSDALNQIMQVASRLGYLDLEALDPDNEAYASIEDARDAHKA